ncbi:YxiG family protein [Gottfriedia luciferensis]|uniref:YxiG family protein n=1 Tax=Gottfriedia luciferensis TaxID=178774 RepID=UPI000B43F0A8|nr:hypothetical protein [Gottfriedia luciferensis]
MESDKLKYLKENLDDLWANVIDEMNIDVFNHRIVFDTRAINDGIVKNYKLIFEDVSSFYFLENTSENRFNLLELDEDSYLELTSIYYYPKGIGLISINSKTDDNWVKQYSSNSNFSIEIWNSMLFVEAKRVVINDKVFDVGYPQ